MYVQSQLVALAYTSWMLSKMSRSLAAEPSKYSGQFRDEQARQRRCRRRAEPAQTEREQGEADLGCRKICVKIVAGAGEILPQLHCG